MKRTYLALAILSTIAILPGCYKTGCTDPDATNFNPDVKTEDFSCTYTSNVVFWAKPGVADSLIVLGHEYIRFELEGQLVDSMSTSGLNAAAGTCNASGTKTISRDFAGDKTRHYKYRVKGLDYQTIYEGFVTLEVGECAAVQLK